MTVIPAIPLRGDVNQKTEAPFQTHVPFTFTFNFVFFKDCMCSVSLLITNTNANKFKNLKTPAMPTTKVAVQ